MVGGGVYVSYRLQRFFAFRPNSSKYGSLNLGLQNCLKFELWCKYSDTYLFGIRHFAPSSVARFNNAQNIFFYRLLLYFRYNLLAVRTWRSVVCNGAKANRKNEPGFIHKEIMSGLMWNTSSITLSTVYTSPSKYNWSTTTFWPYLIFRRLLVQ
jgi:hypothetical protein